jgi:hypothetical protein
LGAEGKITWMVIANKSEAEKPSLNYSSLTLLINLVNTFHEKRSLCLPSTMGLSRLET